MIPAAPTFALCVGQSPGERIAFILRQYDGVALHDPKDHTKPHPRFAELAELVCRGVNDEQMSFWATNCATTALGVLSAAGCPHPSLSKPTRIGMAFSDLVQLGNDMGAWRDPDVHGVPPMGAAMWYHVPNKTVDHVEFMLDAPDEHGGGGRADNAITCGKGGDVHWSWGRPMYRWLDPCALQIPTLDALTQTADPVA